MADQAVLKYLSIDTTFDPCYLSLDSTFKSDPEYEPDFNILNLKLDTDFQRTQFPAVYIPFILFF